MNVHNQKLYKQANLQLCNSEFKMYHQQRISEKKRVQRETQNEVENSEVKSTENLLKGQRSTTQTTTTKYQALIVSRQTIKSFWGTHTHKNLERFSSHSNLIKTRKEVSHNINAKILKY